MSNQKTTTITIGGSPLTINTFYDDRFQMNVEFPQFITLDILKQSKDLMKYCINTLYLRMLTEGEKVIQEIEAIDIEFPHDSALKIRYGLNESALCRAFIPHHQGKEFEIYPLLEIKGDSLGFTVTPGSFSDMDFFASPKGLIRGYAKDFFPSQVGFVTLLLKHFSEMVLDCKINGKSLPKDFEELTHFRFLWNFRMMEIKEKITAHILQEMQKNQKQRIDRIEVDGETIFSLMQKYQIRSSFLLDSTTMMKMAMHLGKPYQIVYRYIEKRTQKLA